MYRKLWSTSLALFACAAVAATGLAAPAATANRPVAKPNAAYRYGQAEQMKTTDHKPQKQPVTLAIGGAEDRESAQLLTKALQQQGLQATVREQKDQPYELTTPLAPNADLAEASKAVMSVNTPQKSAFPPSFDFVLFASLTKEKAKQAMDRLRSLKGVDAQHSRANIDKGELWVRINGSSRVTPDDVHNAIRAAGIDAHFAKQGAKSS